MKNNMKELKFCYDKTLFSPNKTKGNTLKAVWQKSKYWNKEQTLRVFLINGTSEERAEMQRAFREIASYTSLSFVYTTNRYDSDIRVSFNKGWGSYSYLGTDALFIPKTQETMNIGWRGMDVCRHEALHAIGALHEHQNPNEGIQWDEEAVIRDLSGAPNYWTEDEIRFNVLDKINKDTVDTTLFDPDSIMLYYFPSYWTKNNFSSNNNQIFSKTDIDFMRDIYEVTEKDTVAPSLTLNGEQNLTLEVGEEYEELGAEAIDNRDGNISDRIDIDGHVDTSEEGIYYKTYTVSDEAGNTTEKIRTIMVQTKIELKAYLRELFPSEYRLEQLTETQLVQIAQSLDIDASVEDLKVETVSKVWNELNK